ncbi:MAG: molybdenum cofactor cytidylyltransferase [Verrucomicrobia bacterium]|nr:molybdenum cofactor cytidylyltransferase [Verrucomicrobiota bacterium]
MIPPCPPALMITAIVPAAGMSTRMGQNKLLLPFQGKPLIGHAVDTLLASAVDEVIVVLGHDAGKLREKLAGKQVRFVDNPSYREGLSTSVRAGINAVSAQAVGIMIYLADQPLLEPDEVNSLIRAFAEARNAHKNIVVPVYHGQRGNPVIVDVSYKEAILDVVGETGCRRVIKRNPDRVLIVEMEADHAIRDVDTMEEYERLVRNVV